MAKQKIPGFTNMTFDEVRIMAKVCKKEGCNIEETLETLTCIDDCLTITSDCEVIDVRLCPNRTPTAYQRALKDFIEIAGMTKQDAEKYLLQPIQLELFYAKGLGLFAVESAAVESTQIYNPYTGKEIPKEED